MKLNFITDKEITETEIIKMMGGVLDSMCKLAGITEGDIPGLIAWVEARKEPEPCKHENVTPSRDHVVCRDCGSIRTDSCRSWGIARNMWFKNRAEALFYQKNGKLPE